MKKNPIVGIKILKFGRAWRLILQHSDGTDIVSNPKTFLAALEAAKMAWEETQGVPSTQRELPPICQKYGCKSCSPVCNQYKERVIFDAWVSEHNAVRVGTSFVYEARR
jgi:hypothetical protein